MSKRHHVFISHHHADDAVLSQMVNMLSRNGYDVRNSSIRAKPENQRKLDNNEIPKKTLERLLRMKISWSSCVVVLIGRDTSKRPWVNWEIQQAREQGKKVVGVYERGGTDYDVPAAFEDYSNALVNWNTESIIGAIQGTNTSFEDPSGGDRTPVNTVAHGTC
ncbi:MAG: TIR domain-containing protein [Verrucomicrobiota bacterium]